MVIIVSSIAVVSMIWAFIANYIGVSCENCCSFLVLRSSRKKDNLEEEESDDEDVGELSFLII